MLQKFVRNEKKKLHIWKRRSDGVRREEYGTTVDRKPSTFTYISFLSWNVFLCLNENFQRVEEEEKMEISANIVGRGTATFSRLYGEYNCVCSPFFHKFSFFCFFVSILSQRLEIWRWTDRTVAAAMQSHSNDAIEKLRWKLVALIADFWNLMTNECYPI